jgi:hypothetical protein
VRGHWTPRHQHHDCLRFYRFISSCVLALSPSFARLFLAFFKLPNYTNDPIQEKFAALSFPLPELTPEPDPKPSAGETAARSTRADKDNAESAGPAGKDNASETEVPAAPAPAAARVRLSLLLVVAAAGPRDRCAVSCVLFCDEQRFRDLSQ